jgi:hypothetical protein
MGGIKNEGRRVERAVHRLEVWLDQQGKRVGTLVTLGDHSGLARGSRKKVGFIWNRCLLQG